jgi:hypothetical protein
MAGIINNEVVFTPFTEVVKQHAMIAKDLREMIEVLAT